jgi:hypothetical protein
LLEARALLERVRGASLSTEQLEAQRRSFAYGNARLEDETVTKEAVDQAAERLRRR